MFTAIRRITRAGFVGFWRNAYVSLASIFVLTVVLFVIGATMFVDQLLTTSLGALQSKVDINVYFVPTASEEDISSIRKAVEALPDVALVTYTSREEALENFRNRYSNNEITMQALNELGDNPLGANIAIQAKELSQYESISRFLEEQRLQALPQNPVIETVNYGRNKEAIETLNTIMDTVERSSSIITIVLIFAAILITFNTIRLAIYTAREEISIMRLVGASNMFIRGPFLLQGIMYGLVSGVLALLIWYPIMVWLGPRTEAFFEFNLFTYFVSDFSSIFMVIVGTGIVLGFVSSALAIARYLRV
ncbi:MAG: permease-like cell division protein FtsX [Candidatus Paceibacterota bacterium]